MRSDVAAETDPRRRSEAISLAAVVAAFTMIVWGLFALDRGLFQDDAQILADVWSRDGLWRRLTTPVVAPTRILAGAPAALALLFPNPALALQVLYGILWALAGVLLYFIARRLFPDSRRVAFFACALTLSATSDYLTDSPVAIHYCLSSVFFLIALLAFLNSWKSGRWGWGVVFVLAVSASLWTTDSALPGILLVPVLLWAATNGRLSRRLFAHAVAWYAPVIPYLVVLIRFLRDPQSYAARAVTWLAPAEWIRKSWTLFLYNFQPWRWAAGRENWFAAPPPVLSPRFAPFLALFGLAIFLWALPADPAGESRVGPPAEPPVGPSSIGGRRRAAGIAAVSLFAAFLSNAAFAPVQVSEVFYRTHVCSRLWSSLALAVLAGVLLSRPSRLSFPSLALLVLFVGLGLEGGVERQGYYLSYWKRHRVELRSILAAAPNLQPEARVVLYVDSSPPLFRATAVGYLASSWLKLFYERQDMGDRVFVWSLADGAACEARSDRLVCYSNSLQRSEIEYANALLFRYDPGRNRYDLVPSLFGVLPDGSSRALSAYDPGRLIRFGRPSPLARELLAPPRFLASRLPAFFHARRRVAPVPASPLGLPLGPAQGRIESVEALGDSAGRSPIPRNAIVRVSGSVSIAGDRPPLRAVILSDERGIAETSAFVRPPAAAGSAPEAAGPELWRWEARFRADALGPGPHRIEVLIVDSRSAAARRLPEGMPIRLAD
ncbi:MAG: hypothetical protein ACRD16_06205 [Thermoanaerobaculia bacterium]